MSVLGQPLYLLSSILTILLTCPNSDTLVCYSNDPVYSLSLQGPLKNWLGKITRVIDPVYKFLHNSQKNALTYGSQTVLRRQQEDVVVHVRSSVSVLSSPDKQLQA